MIFDDNGKVVDRAALRSVGVRPAGFTAPRKWLHNGDKNRSTEVIDDDTGRVMAHSTEHRGSDRVDANVFPQPATAGAGAKQ